MKKLQFGPDYILPKPMDPRLITKVSSAVAKAAMDSGVARKNITNWKEYEDHLNQLMGYEGKMVRNFYDMAQADPKRVVFAEATHKIGRASCMERV